MINNITPEAAALALVAKQLKSGYVWEALHGYKDLSGNTLFWRIRLKHASGDKWIRPMYKGNNGKYLLKEPPQFRDSLKPLYNQPLLVEFSSATVVIVEGELKADILNAFFIRHNAGDKFIAITSGSATSATNADWQPLHNRTCIIWPDNDDPGFNYASIVCEKLSLLGCQTEIFDVATLNLKSCGDCADWVNDNPGYNLGNFLSIAKQDMCEPVEEVLAVKGSNQASELVAFILERSELCHDKNKDVYAIDKQTNEVRQIEGRQFRDFLTANFYECYCKSIRDQVMREALNTISGIGRCARECRIIFRRVAYHDNCYYLDLCQAGNSKVVKINSGSWEIIEAPPVLFVRSDTMQPLPIPIKGGDLSVLWKICNIPLDSQLLVLAWLAESLRPNTPYPVLEIVGEQGTAKSTTQTALRRLIDPNACDLRAAPKQPEDLYVAANANHFVSCENISHLSAPMQDALCVTSTGGGHAKRKLYTDSDESVIHSHNPVIINGIAAAITAQDLIDRAITIELPVITERHNVTNIRLLFEDEHAQILGGLLDLFANALSIIPDIKLSTDNAPRLIEFAVLGMAIAEALGVPGDEFMKQFNSSRRESITRTIESSPVASALIEWFDASGRRHATLAAKDLLSRVEQYKPHGTEAWPKSPRGFADVLRRIAPPLRQMGIECRRLGKQGSYGYWEVFSKESA